MTFMGVKLDLNTYVKLFQTMESSQNVLGRNDDALTYIAYLLGNDHDGEVFAYSTQLYQAITEHKDRIAQTYQEAMQMRLNNFNQNFEQTGNVFEDSRPVHHTELDDDTSHTRSVLYQRENKKTRNQFKK